MRCEVRIDQCVPPAVTDDVGPVFEVRDDGRRGRLDDRVLFDGGAAVVNRIDLCFSDGCFSVLFVVREGAGF
ncbi:hypothetical protein ACIQTZ_14620 [Paenarthrobacter sp. NPDC090520]|uniref:hypothetical protein n=1 Tax=unclassified Paenarthrobacter TaxID=2634190 RepID=UPI0037FBF51C